MVIPNGPGAVTNFDCVLKAPRIRTYLFDTRLHILRITSLITLQGLLPLPEELALVDRMSCHVHQLHILVHLERRRLGPRDRYRGREPISRLPDTRSTQPELGILPGVFLKQESLNNPFELWLLPVINAFKPRTYK